MHIANNVPEDAVVIGAVQVDGVRVERSPQEIEEALDACIVDRALGLTEAQDAMRVACRRMLRHGSYRASGRGKPASEYLLRAAAKEFPRINGPVDAINLTSLKYLVPISVWDVELAAAEHYEVRLGRPEEQYLFNTAGQTLALRDLVCGCRFVDGPDSDSEPIVTPIKDSHATKVRPESKNLAAIIYFPSSTERDLVDSITKELCDWLRKCGAQTSNWHVV